MVYFRQAVQVEQFFAFFCKNSYCPKYPDESANGPPTQAKEIGLDRADGKSEECHIAAGFRLLNVPSVELKRRRQELVTPKEKEAAWKKYANFVLNTARKNLIDKSQAEDIVQEVFIVLWEQYNARNNTSAIIKFLHWATLNKCMNFNKKKANHEANKLDAPVDNEISSSVKEQIPDTTDYGKPEAILMAKTLSEPLEDCLKRLSEQQCHAILLVDADGLSHEEAAKELGISQNKLKRVLGNGRGKLIECMKESKNAYK